MKWKQLMNFVGKQDTIQHFATVTVARIRTSVQETTKTKNNQMKEFDSPRGIRKDDQTAAFFDVEHHVIFFYPRTPIQC